MRKAIASVVFLAALAAVACMVGAIEQSLIGVGTGIVWGAVSLAVMFGAAEAAL